MAVMFAMTCSAVCDSLSVKLFLSDILYFIVYKCRELLTAGAGCFSDVFGPDVEPHFLAYQCTMMESRGVPFFYQKFRKHGVYAAGKDRDE